MLVIRLFRVGKKNQPAFKIVVTDKRKSSTKGPSVEEVGFYNPLTKEKVLKQDRIKYWLSVGAQPSNTVHNLLVAEKILEGKKIDVHKKSKKPAVAESSGEVKPEEKPTEAPVEAKPQQAVVEEKPAEEGTKKAEVLPAEIAEEKEKTE
ncbi:MAG: 30S ribosomal protein S16 [bacterium]